MSAQRPRVSYSALGACLFVVLLSALGAGPAARTAGSPARASSAVVANRPLDTQTDGQGATHVAAPATTLPRREPVAATTVKSTAPAPAPLALDAGQVVNSVKTVGIFAVASLAPVAVLMFTAFVRINIVLMLLRQALGSPQIPGNQVLAALALLLTALVMKPVAESVYTRGIEPFAAGRVSAPQAWEAGTQPLKLFMVRQIERTNHQDYLWQLYDLSTPEAERRVDPVYGEEFPLRVVAPAFLLSELTTALVMGFYLYLPFLVIDLVVSAALAAMGLFMLPPSMVALPLKLILFVLADGWLLVATVLLRSFAT